MSVLSFLTPRKRHTHRAGITHLARVLWQAHNTTWGTLSLKTSHSRPAEHKLTGSVGCTGAIQYHAIINRKPVSLIITQREYQKALGLLPLDQQEAIQRYYTRHQSVYDTCPTLDGHHDQYAAFKVLYYLLVIPQVEAA